MIKGKTLQIPMGTELLSKLAKAQKELKASSMAECGRILLDFTLENDISGLHQRVKKAELEKRHQSIAEKLQALEAEKAATEKAMEQLSA